MICERVCTQGDQYYLGTLDHNTSRVGDDGTYGILLHCNNAVQKPGALGTTCGINLTQMASDDAAIQLDINLHACQLLINPYKAMQQQQGGYVLLIECTYI